MNDKIKTASEILAQTAANLYDVRRNPTEAAVIAAYDNIVEAKEYLDAAKTEPSLDRETRLRMIAEAVSGRLANELNAALSELSKNNIRVLVELEDGDEPQQAAYMPLYDLDEHPELDPDKPEFCEREHRNMRRDLADRDFARKKNAEYREAGFLKGGGATQ